MEITAALALPRDELSVPVVRRILKQSLEHASGSTGRRPSATSSSP